MTAPVQDSLATRLCLIKQQIAEAANRAGRSPQEITLLPVSKTFGEEDIREAVSLGLTRLGENKVQEIKTKFEPLADCRINWVMIGHLQTNKAKEIARMASEVQSLDRLELAVALQKRLEIENRTLDVLVQVKTSSEPSKYGLPAEELLPFVRQVAADMPLLRIKGLMTLAVNSPEREVVRQCFRQLRQLRDQVQQQNIAGVDMDRLSMGMSGDFDIAIEEGATEVRIGTALFGRRDYGYDHYWPERQL
ncbi:YggS family pyridoxal phosphate-dependent enzyme [Chromatiaceae bacterium AAb-1]|nr:YggS family pyridoxal phosphate-dependent enzyme [Chromatiaceae bacterium AAb-1]